MIPSFSVFDPIDCRSANVELRSNCGWMKSGITEFSYFCGGLIGKFSLMVFFAAWHCRRLSADRMIVILLGCYISKILNRIVCSGKVNMIDLHSCWAGTDESCHYKTMDLNTFFYGFLRKAYASISIFVNARLQDYLSITIGWLVMAQNSANVGDRIQPFITRNWQPTLSCGRTIISHLRTVLRGRLERKRCKLPLCARPFYQIKAA